MLKKGAHASDASIKLFGTESRSGFIAPSSIEQVFQVPSPEDPNYLPELSSIIKSYEIDLVIPQTTNESKFLSVHKSQVGTKVAVLGSQDFEMLNNKGYLTEAFLAANLPAPEMYWVSSYSEFLVAVDKLNYPENEIVIKLPSASGMRGVRKVSESHENLEEFLSNKPNVWSLSKSDLVEILGRGIWPKMLAIPFLHGPEYSVDVWRRDGIAIILPRIRSHIRSGISMESNLELEPAISEVVSEFLEHYDIEGLLGFQFIMHQGTPQILECNPRVQGTMVASLLSGVNILWLEVKWQLNLPTSEEEIQLTSGSGHFKRLWSGELFYSNGYIETI